MGCQRVSGVTQIASINTCASYWGVGRHLGTNTLDGLMERLTPEQMEAVQDSEALCEGCGANPRKADDLTGWFIASEQTPHAVLAVIRCPHCW